MINTALHNLKINSLNSMQQEALNAAEDRDCVILSPTGSGKTLAFLLPLLKYLKKDIQGVQALIIVPSRELALQIEQVFRAMKTGYKVNCCYGGHQTKTEINNFESAPALLIGTPGRLTYHLRNGSFDTINIKMLILDEFDKALEYGFHSDMDFIISNLKNLRKRVLTSATDMEVVPEFTGVTNPFIINFLTTDKAESKLQIKAIYADAAEKLNTLFLLICKVGATPALVFCNHKESVDRITDFLYKKNVGHDIFHGGMIQEEREKTLAKFRNGTNYLLITTDLASRGLDIPEIAYVIHYQLPVSEQAFTHRNGRTARMHAGGTSYLILTQTETVKYLQKEPESETLSENYLIPPPSSWSTLYISGGKKDKINKVDIVGLLLKKGNLKKDELGLIEVLDHVAYAAVKSHRINEVLSAIKTEKLKNKKVKIELAR